MRTEIPHFFSIIHLCIDIRSWPQKSDILLGFILTNFFSQYIISRDVPALTAHNALCFIGLIYQVPSVFLLPGIRADSVETVSKTITSLMDNHKSVCYIMQCLGLFLFAFSRSRVLRVSPWTADHLPRGTELWLEHLVGKMSAGTAMWYLVPPCFVLTMLLWHWMWGVLECLSVKQEFITLCVNFDCKLISVHCRVSWPLLHVKPLYTIIFSQSVVNMKCA